MKSHFIVAIVCAFVIGACATFGVASCPFGASRCQGNTVQVCRTGMGWSDSINCDDVSAGEGGKWLCGTPKGAYAAVQCVPEKTESSEPEKTEKKESPRGSR